MENLREGVEFIFSSYKRTAAILFVAAMALAIPVTVSFLGQNQDIRQQASQVCENVAADIMLIIDKSGSMKEATSNTDTATRMTRAKAAASQFIDSIATNTNNRAGLVSFSTEALTTLNSPFTNSFATVKQKINELNPDGQTCTQCGIRTANQHISQNKRAGIKNVVILLTDGQANVTIGNSNDFRNFIEAREKAIQEAITGYNQNNTTFFTIGLGSNVRADFLQQIAAETGGKYFFAPTANDLTSIYQQISQIIGKAAITGFVYDDANNNGTLDTNEVKLPGWTLNLTTTQSSTLVNATTDSSGGFSFSGLCNGEYTLRPTAKSGWTVTSPSNGTHQIILTNGAPASEKSFGVTSASLSPSPTHTPIPTPTCSPRPACLDDVSAQCQVAEPDGGWCPAPTTISTPTSLRLLLELEGIGLSTNPALILNNNPKRPTRNVEIKIFNSQNQEVKSLTHNFTYRSNGEGFYEGIVPLGSGFQSGTYLVKFRFDNTLWKTFPGIQNFTAGIQNSTAIPTAEAVSGDVNKDNEINLLDYNMFVSCLKLNQCGNGNTAGILESIFAYVKNIFTVKVFAQTQNPTATPTPASYICGTIAGLACPTGFSCTGLDPNISDAGGTCVANPTCGDNVCQEITCQAIGCPAPETTTSCPADCGTQNPTATATPIPPTIHPSVTPAPTLNPTVNTPQKAIFDFNDDGKVEELDYNILYAGFATRHGE